MRRLHRDPIRKPVEERIPESVTVQSDQNRADLPSESIFFDTSAERDGGELGAEADGQNGRSGTVRSRQKLPERSHPRSPIQDRCGRASGARADLQDPQRAPSGPVPKHHPNDVPYDAVAGDGERRFLVEPLEIRKRSFREEQLQGIAVAAEYIGKALPATPQHPQLRRTGAKVPVQFCPEFVRVLNT